MDLEGVARNVAWELSWFPRGGGTVLGNVILDGAPADIIADAVAAAMARASAPPSLPEHVLVGEVAVDPDLASVLQPYVADPIDLGRHVYFIGMTDLGRGLSHSR
jgi:hypothetical protein